MKCHHSCFTAFAAVSCVFVFCTVPLPHRSYTLNRSYATANLSNRKLVIVMPNDAGILINNKRDVTNDFGGANATPESRIRKYYFPEFVKTFKSLVSSDSAVSLAEVRPDLTEDSLGAQDTALKTDTDTLPVAYRIPSKSRMQALGLEGSVAVIVERIEFKRNAFYIEYYWDEKTRKSANLQADARVLIWDCKSETPVFYGTLTSTIDFQFGLQRKHWDESAADIAKKIIVAAKCL
jgi:hypothetical protein